MKPEHVELIENIFDSELKEDCGASFFVNEDCSWISFKRFEKLIAAIEAEKDNEISVLNNFNAMQAKALKDKQASIAELERENERLQHELGRAERENIRLMTGC